MKESGIGSVVSLATNSEDILELSDFKRFGFSVHAWTHGYGAKEFFYFWYHDLDALENFIAGLKKIVSDNGGHVTIKAEMDNELHFKLNELGHLAITGILKSYDYAFKKQLEFGFRTDQTCLEPFIRDLERVRAEIEQ